jgi:hypothetical protein
MRRLWLLVVCAWAAFLVGCVAEGKRTVTIEFLGQTIKVEDEVSPNSEGVQTYKAGFDEESSVVAAILGWMTPEPSDKPPKPESVEETADDSGG